MYRTPTERALRRRRLVVRLALFAVALLIVSVLDGPVYRWLADPEKGVERADWYQLLRQTGNLLTWIIAALLIILHDRTAAKDADPTRSTSPQRWRGVLVFVSPLVAGLLAEVLKLVVGRSRPVAATGAYEWRGLFSGFLDGSNLGMPSSHAATAFGGAFALALLVPWTRHVVLVLAAGCCVTRLLTGAHFLSDVFVGGAIGYAVSGRLVPRTGRETLWP